jgi:acylphosphatase
VLLLGTLSLGGAEAVVGVVVAAPEVAADADAQTNIASTSLLRRRAQRRRSRVGAVLAASAARSPLTRGERGFRSLQRLTVRRRVIVHGRVQGVGFRFAVARAAEARAVTGWVRNRADGAVEAVFDGEPAPVESLTRFCGEGPRAAAVARIEAIEEEPEGLSRFDVR